MNYKFAIMAAAAISLSACATVTKGSKDTVKITSTPSDASVTFEDTAMKYQDQGCTTPCEIELPRKQTYKTTVEKAGHEPFVYILEPKVSTSGGAGMAGNILLGGVIGAAVDASTGAMRDLSPDPVNVTLEPTGGTSTAVDSKGREVRPMGKDMDADKEMKDEEEGEPMASLDTPSVTDAG